VVAVAVAVAVEQQVQHHALVMEQREEPLLRLVTWEAEAVTAVLVEMQIPVVHLSVVQVKVAKAIVVLQQAVEAVAVVLVDKHPSKMAVQPLMEVLVQMALLVEFTFMWLKEKQDGYSKLRIH
jgi:hypothetical protein